MNTSGRAERLRLTLEATREVAVPLVSGVLIIVTVFTPLLSLQGLEGRLFRPVALTIGFALGAVTAAMGPKAAMACTAAIETEIDLHYEEQLQQLGEDDPELSALIKDFQAEEVEHRDAAIAHA